MKNEITLIVGKLGSGKSTLAARIFEENERAIILTSFPKDFSCPYTDSLRDVAEKDKICFFSDDIVQNEIAIRIAYEKGHGLLIIDEAHLYQDSESFKKVIRYSRHKKLDVILISHTLFDFARLNRVLVNNIYVFSMSEPYEVSYLKRIRELPYQKIPKYHFVVVQGDILPVLRKHLILKDGFFKLTI